MDEAVENNLPPGTIVRRIIRGKERFYHQWRENGKTLSRYLKADEVLPLREKIEKRKAILKRRDEGLASTDGYCLRFSCGVLTGKRLAELAASKIKPINFYYFPAFAGEDGGAAENARALDRAVKYGVPRIMTIPPYFTRGGDEEREFVRNTENLKKFVAMGKTRGITVTVEDFGGTNNACSHVKYLKRMMEAIPDLRYALDSGNLYYAGRGEDILDMMAYAKGRIAHVHLKDQTAEDNHRYTSLGLGAVPNEKIVKTTWADGYDGWYTLENTVGDVYVDTARQVAVLKAWLSGK